METARFLAQEGLLKAYSPVIPLVLRAGITSGSEPLTNVILGAGTLNVYKDLRGVVEAGAVAKQPHTLRLVLAKYTLAGADRPPVLSLIVGQSNPQVLAAFLEAYPPAQWSEAARRAAYRVARSGEMVTALRRFGFELQLGPNEDLPLDYPSPEVIHALHEATGWKPTSADMVHIAQQNLRFADRTQASLSIYEALKLFDQRSEKDKGQLHPDTLRFALRYKSPTWLIRLLVTRYPSVPFPMLLELYDFARPQPKQMKLLLDHLENVDKTSERLTLWLIRCTTLSVQSLAVALRWGFKLPPTLMSALASDNIFFWTHFLIGRLKLLAPLYQNPYQSELYRLCFLSIPLPIASFLEMQNTPIPQDEAFWTYLLVYLRSGNSLEPILVWFKSRLPIRLGPLLEKLERAAPMLQDRHRELRAELERLDML